MNFEQAFNVVLTLDETVSWTWTANAHVALL